MNKYIFDWKGFQGKSDKGTVYSGRPRGKSLRDANKLDARESNPDFFCVITFENSTLTITSSFLLGLFEKSIQKMGEAEFRRKYEFNVPGGITQPFNASLDYIIGRALTNNESPLF